jgi:hypothetical protein
MNIHAANLSKYPIQMPSRKVLLILGMHRSGTSLSANWLGSCGLDLGQNLIGATPSNILGHFEDVDIVEFHEKLLRFNDTSLYQGEGPPLVFNEYHIAKARSLVYLRDQFGDQWGWKQPRACLFLPLWRKVLPEAHYFLIYRPFEEVITSLYRREFKKLARKNPFPSSAIKQFQFRKSQKKLLRQYLSMWVRHNQELLDHLGKLSREKVLLTSVKGLVDKEKQIFHHLTDTWDFQLEHVSLKSIYQPNLLLSQSLQLPAEDPLVLKAREITLRLKEVEFQTKQG